MTMASSLHSEDGTVVYTNKIFCDLFKTDNKKLVSNKLSTKSMGVEIVSQFDVFEFINNNISNIDNLIIRIKHNNEYKLIKVNNLIIKNGNTCYVLLYEDVTNNLSQSYLYKELFNNIKKGIIILRSKNGIDFLIKDLNPFVENNETIDKKEFVNKNINDINFFNEDIINLISDVWKTGNKIELNNVECGNSDNICWRNVYIYKVFTGDIILIYEDTTEIVNNKKKLEDFNKQKTTFLSNMSHEIRNPVNTIVGFSDLLSDCKNGYIKQREYINIIKESAKMLTKLINDVLDMTKIESGKLDLVKGVFDVNRLINELHTTNKGNTNKGVKLLTNKQFSTFKINNDEIRFRQVFNNLLSNAIKFTKSGQIEFGYKKDKDDIVFYVKDTGIGIKKEDFPKIFKRFEQLNTDKRIGHGLGLSISNELVKLMGGQLWFDSEFKSGSTFYFTVSNEELDENRSLKRGKKSNKDLHLDLNNKTILIVEDIDFNAKLLISYLEETNANIIVAVDGNDALIKYNKNKKIIDLILMDIQIPNMNGNEVTRVIRTVDKDIPIIAQTAYAINEEIPNILKNGFNDLIKKPIEKEELFKIIDKYI